ncbi:MAG: GNAT family protein [Pseudomonadota bacterium]
MAVPDRDGSERDLFCLYIDKATGKALGNGALMSIAEGAGSIEVGSIMFAPALKGTRAATEAMYLKMKWAFEAGYRRYEWTCDALNAASMAAAARLGFSYEACFRQAYVTKGRNRDKACFAITDADWPALKAVFEAWLDPANFDAAGTQQQRLSALTGPLLRARAPAFAATRHNATGQPIGPAVASRAPATRPGNLVLEGRYCRLEQLTPAHAGDMFEAIQDDAEGRIWTYMPNGPFDSLAGYAAWLNDAIAVSDPLQFAIMVDGKTVGTASYLRIDPQHGTIEVGFITFTPRLQKTRAATEAMYLMMRWAFENGYRRYEWKCNDLNAPSRRAAQRYGFSYEGTFGHALVVKGGNRDTAWYAAIDSEWPGLKAAFDQWLAPDNFDSDGQQRVSLSALTAPILVAKG